MRIICGIVGHSPVDWNVGGSTDVEWIVFVVLQLVSIHRGLLACRQDLSRLQLENKRRTVVLMIELLRRLKSQS